MNKSTAGSHNPLYLGIEAGATRTVARVERWDGSDSKQIETGPANLRLLSDVQLTRHLREIARALPAPAALAIGMAGARTAADWRRLERAANRVWPKVPCYATNDLETALMAAEELSQPAAHSRGGSLGRRVGSKVPVNGRLKLASDKPRVLVLCGTGSCCFGRTPSGKTAKVGGWGHLIGDKGSAYEIGLRGLKAVVFYFDRDGKWPALGGRLLRALQLNEPDDLIRWTLQSGKAEIASLAVEVFRAWSQGDKIATDIIESAICSLAADAVGCARRLVGKNTPVQFILAGGVLLKQPAFARRVARRIQQGWRRAVISPLEREGVAGALALARQQFPVATIERALFRRGHRVGSPATQPWPGKASTKPDTLKALAQSPTEERHPLSQNLDQLPLRQAITLMLREDEKVPANLLKQRADIERAIIRIVHSLRRGGRLFYLGAGTSGRLGVLDASECPPTFRTDPNLVQGIIAGGQSALWQAVEGAEDDSLAGARAIAFRQVTRRDSVVGIAASGRTPFVWGGLSEAKQRGATTILLSFNPSLRISLKDRPDVVITPRIGPEILTGSTRLKAGTATKLVLNIFTTLAMVRLGKVLGNLMIDVNPSNDKLRDRAVRIVVELTGATASAARAELMRNGWQIRAACARLGRRQGYRTSARKKPLLPVASSRR